MAREFIAYETDTHLPADPAIVAAARKAFGSERASSFNPLDFGAVGDGVTDDTSALQAAFDAATTAAGTVIGGGSYRTTSTLVLQANADLAAMTVLYEGTGVALAIGAGTSILQRRVIVAPRVILSTKTSVLGWQAGTVGIRLRAAYGTVLTVPHVKNFDIGLQLYGQAGQGVSYCTIIVGGLDNNRVNLDFNADATGWANQNTIMGGRFSHDTAEGTQVSGTRHVRLSDIATSRPNNNTFLNCSFESTNVVEFAIDIESGSYNTFLTPRLEDTTNAARVRFGPKAQLNTIHGGFGVAASMNVTRVAGQTRNAIQSNDFTEMQGASTPMLRYENQSGSGAATLAVYAAGTFSAAYSAATDWLFSVASTATRWKNKTDTQERVRIEAQGRIYLGPGIDKPPVVYLSGTQTDLQLNAGDLIPDATATRSLGKTALQWLNVFASRVTVGTAQILNGTGSPEAAVTAPVGSIYTRSDGAAGSTLYVKESGTGNTGWAAK